mgnify:CR=1 FL=1
MQLKTYWKDTEGIIFHITSERDPSIIYVVAVDIKDGWYCTCEDYKFRKHKCKHIRKATEYIQKNYQSEYEKYNQLEVFVKIIKGE